MPRRTKADAEQTRRNIIEAARHVFCERGVGHTTLGNIAQVAGVTRGAVYGHFEDKAAVFFAMWEQALVKISRSDRLLQSLEKSNPLDRLEQEMIGFFALLESNTEVSEAVNAVLLRCEYVEELMPMRDTINQYTHGFFAQIAEVYAMSKELGCLKEGVDPKAMAHDTISFSVGLLHTWMTGSVDGFREHAPDMIRNHIALRRSDKPLNLTFI